MQMKMMPLIGVAVPDLEVAVSRFSSLFDLDFKIFTAGVDYAASGVAAAPGDTAPPLPAHVRIAVDTKDNFELLELPDAPEGFRNMHLRVDDIDGAVAHFRSRGLTPVQDLRAGLAREIIFDASDVHGIRVCILQFEGDSFAAALAASPRAATTTEGADDE